MASLDVVLLASSAALSAGLGLFVLAGNLRRPTNQFLGLFLLLIAGNQGAEILRRLAANPEARTFWFQIGSTFAFLDPLALYYFVSIFPERDALNDRWKVGLVLAGSLALLSAAPWLEMRSAGHVPSLLVQGGWATFTAAVYVIALLHVLSRLLEGEGSPENRLLFPALALAAVPAWSRAFSTVGIVLRRGLDQQILHGSDPWIRLVSMGVLVAFVLARTPRRGEGDPATRRWIVGGMGVALGFALLARPFSLYKAAAGLGLVGAQPPAWLPPIGASGPLRWMAFSLIVSTAILRHQILDLSLGVRRWAARALVGLGLVGLVGLASLVVPLGSGIWVLAPGDLLVLGAVALLSPTVRGTIDRVAARIYAIPDSGDLAGVIETYRAGVEQAISEGRTLESDPELARLREELDLDARTANVIERMAGSRVPDRLEPGQLLAGRYRIEQHTGRGGVGRAFRARDELIERPVAIKEILTDVPGREEKIVREARIAGSLNHPNVLTVHDVLRGSGSAFLVTEYVPEGSLADRLASEDPLSIEDGLQLVNGVLAGLEAVHEAGVVHRDLKPGNVLLLEDGTPRLADFGAARLRTAATRRFEAGETVEGTPAYMSPEQRRGQPATTASDLYAVGLIAREAVEDSWPEPVDAVLRRALRDDPGDRWASATAMREALRAASRSITPES